MTELSLNKKIKITSSFKLFYVFYQFNLLVKIIINFFRLQYSNIINMKLFIAYIFPPQTPKINELDCVVDAYQFIDVSHTCTSGEKALQIENLNKNRYGLRKTDNI